MLVSDLKIEVIVVNLLKGVPMKFMTLVSLAFISFSTLAGDAANGAKLYAAKGCVTCHGKNGEGNAAMKAPRIAGQFGWYVEAQIKFIKEGKRTTGASATMKPMVASLSDKDMQDIGAHLEKLK